MDFFILWEEYINVCFEQFLYLFIPIFFFIVLNLQNLKIQFKPNQFSTLCFTNSIFQAADRRTESRPVSKKRFFCDLRGASNPGQNRAG